MMRSNSSPPVSNSRHRKRLRRGQRGQTACRPGGGCRAGGAGEEVASRAGDNSVPRRGRRERVPCTVGTGDGSCTGGRGRVPRERRASCGRLSVWGWRFGWGSG
eukprot:3050541-Prymnesium_polylepis.1